MQQFNHKVCCSMVPSGKALQPSVVKVFNSPEEQAAQKPKAATTIRFFILFAK